MALLMVVNCSLEVRSEYGVDMPIPRLAASRDSFPFRKNRQELKAAFILALANLAPMALAELTDCFPVPRGDFRRSLRKDRRPRRTTGRTIFAWPAFDAWAGKYGLLIASPADDWVRIWAASLEVEVAAPTPLTRFRGLANAYNSSWRSEKKALEQRGLKTRVRDRRLGRQTARLAEALVRWQVLRQPWGAILADMRLAPDRLADIHRGVRETADTLSLKRRIGRRGRPKI